MKIVGLMACDPCGLIGAQGNLPWHYPEETAHFRAVTKQQTLIMGRKTFESLPAALLLDRQYIVFSRQQKNNPSHQKIRFVASLDACFDSIGLLRASICYMIGGGEITALFFEKNLLAEFILTRIKKKYVGDIFLPKAILNWPHVLIKNNADFSIDHYFNPKESS
jgi:dihydrofolate reductase